MFQPDPTTTDAIDIHTPDGAPRARPHESCRQARQLGLAARTAKRAVDIVGALVFFTLFGPLYLIVAAAVLLSMGQPIHYWHTRLGRGGRGFRFYKFRSMVHDADAALEEHLGRNDAARTQWEAFQKLEDDPRITAVGRLIRRLSLDELPQFWNVLIGDMSLVGPRPCMERQKALYGSHWGGYCAMRPGITGLWQVSGRNRLPFAKRAELDAYYVDNWSLWLDIRILLKTLGTVVAGDGAR
jgi:exopolysaccharide production protein ExoY